MSLHKFLTLKTVKELYLNDSSCIKKVSSNYLLLLHPLNSKNIVKGIKNELSSMLKVYIIE